MSLKLWKSIIFAPRAYFCQNINQLKRIKESKLASIIQNAINVTYLSVKDTSVGGSACGQMYKIVVESPDFINLSKIDQHKLITNALADQLKQIHGFELKTRQPSQKVVEKVIDSGNDKQNI